MQHPAAIFASDSWPEPGGHQNPAAYGTFPKFLRNARERNTLSLEGVVHKMSGAAAERFRLQERGVLREGYAADITVFDWERVGDQDNPSGDAAPTGIEEVFVNGQKIFDHGRADVGPRAGRVLLS